MRRGFSLLELLLVLAIMAVLIAVVTLAVDPVMGMLSARTQALELERVDTAVTAHLLLSEQELPPRLEPAPIATTDSDAPFAHHLRSLPTRYGYAWDAAGHVTQYLYEAEGQPLLTPLGNTPQEIATAMMALMRSYYDENSDWARSWSPYCYSDLGLDPDFWDDPIEGIRYRPHGVYLGLTNVSGDDVQIYVRTLDGSELHLYDGWNIWVCATDEVAYYHLYPHGDPGETLVLVDIDSLRIVRAP